MARCVYCGQPAGFLRKWHAECHNRHQIAISMVPRFFSQVLESQVSVARFTELLRAAADASYVQPDELKSLCVSGVHRILESILQQRPPSPPEVVRVTELIDGLGEIFTDGLGLDELLVKVSIVSDLANGKISDNVSLVGPVPVQFGRGETILWVFNHVRAYRKTSNDKNTGLKVKPGGPTDASYVSPNMLEDVHVVLKQLNDETVGDMVITNRNIFFLQNESAITRIPIARISLLHVYAEGIHVECRPVEQRSRTFLLSDTWFAANVITLLGQLAHRGEKPEPHPTL